MSQSLLPWVRNVMVGSTNPVKLAAVRAVMARVAPGATVHGTVVASGVPDQPWGDDETQRGAAERARRALASAVFEGAGSLTNPTADLGVGLEGGVVELPDGTMRTCAWAVVLGRDGRQGIGGSMAIPLPASVVAMLRQGMELGHAIDTMARLVDTRHGSGAVGVLTAGLVDRQRAYEPLVSFALAPFLAPAYYAAVGSGSVDEAPPLSGR